MSGNERTLSPEEIAAAAAQEREGAERSLKDHFAERQRQADHRRAEMTATSLAEREANLDRWTRFFCRWANIFQQEGITADQAYELWPAAELEDNPWINGFQARLRDDWSDAVYSAVLSAMDATEDAVRRAGYSMNQMGCNGDGALLWYLRPLGVAAGVEATTARTPEKAGTQAAPASAARCPHNWRDHRCTEMDLAVPICTYCHEVDWEVFIVAVREFGTAAAVAAIGAMAPPNSLLYALSNGELLRIDTSQAPSDPRERAILLGLLGHAERTVQTVEAQQSAGLVAGQASVPR